MDGLKRELDQLMYERSGNGQWPWVTKENLCNQKKQMSIRKQCQERPWLLCTLLVPPGELVCPLYETECNTLLGSLQQDFSYTPIKFNIGPQCLQVVFHCLPLHKNWTSLVVSHLKYEPGLTLLSFTRSGKIKLAWIASIVLVLVWLMHLNKNGWEKVEEKDLPDNSRMNPVGFMLIFLWWWPCQDTSSTYTQGALTLYWVFRKTSKLALLICLHNILYN